MPEDRTGTFLDIDPENWKEFVDVKANCATGGAVSSSGSGDPQRESTPSALVTEYWQAALDLVDAWASYQRAKKAEINSSYSETRFKVSGVIDEYWGGDSKLHKSVNSRSSLVDMSLESFFHQCARVGVDPVTRDWLYHNLRESRDYERYRGKIKRRLARTRPAVSLREL